MFSALNISANCPTHCHAHILYKLTISLHFYSNPRTLFPKIKDITPTRAWSQKETNL